MGLDRVTTTTNASPSAQSLLDFFVEKIEAIRRSTGDSPAVTKLSPATSTFDGFHELSVDEVYCFITSSKSKSCSLDPMPASILKECLPELLPFITAMCNKSLLEGHLPSSQKSAIISPVIKKSGLDPDDVRSYRPISNLTYMSKIIERMVYKQLTDYLGKHSLLPKHQSGFRANHPTETAVLKIMSDILGAADHGKVTLLGLLDMSAAFDTVDHSILLDRLGTSFGIKGTALAWLRSFITGRKQWVFFNGVSSSTIYITTGVPQGKSIGTVTVPIVLG